jgi:hypothetical protein
MAKKTFFITIEASSDLDSDGPVVELVSLENLEMSGGKGIAVHGECYSLSRTTRVEQLAGLVDGGEHNSHDASASTELRSDANCKGPK